MAQVYTLSDPLQPQSDCNCGAEEALMSSQQTRQLKLAGFLVTAVMVLFTIILLQKVVRGFRS